MIINDVIDLPKNCYHVYQTMPPKRWQIALIVVSIVIVAIAWSLS